MGQILEANVIYSDLRENLKERIKPFLPLRLASLQVSKSYGSSVYRLAQEKMAEFLGVDYVSVDLKQNISYCAAVDKLKSLNEDKSIAGIIINRPLPVKWDKNSFFSSVDIKKDIEAVHPYNLGLIVSGKPFFIPPTVLSVLEFLRLTKIELKGKDVVLVGFSTIIGKPLSVLLADKLATVNITHIGTSCAGKLPFYVSNADVVISAVGKPEVIKGSWIKQGAVVIDVGIGEKEGKTVGDIEFDEAFKHAGFITPVPGGVGKLTTLFLFENVLRSVKL